jgi:type I restriction-modification system DNA methylase subunit
MAEENKPKERYLTEGELLAAIDWWTARRNKAQRHAKWFMAASEQFRQLAKNGELGPNQIHRLLQEANEAEEEAAPLFQLGVLKLEELKQKLAEFRTQPMAGVIADGGSDCRWRE